MVDAYAEMKEYAVSVGAPLGTFRLRDESHGFLLNHMRDVIGYLIRIMGIQLEGDNNTPRILHSHILYAGDGLPLGHGHFFTVIFVSLYVAYEDGTSQHSCMWPHLVADKSEETALGFHTPALRDDLEEFFADSPLVKQLNISQMIITGDHKWLSLFFCIKACFYKCVKCAVPTCLWPYMTCFVPNFSTRDMGNLLVLGDAARMEKRDTSDKAHSLKYQGLNARPMLVPTCSPGCVIAAPSIMHSTMHLVYTVCIPLLAFLLKRHFKDQRLYRQFLDEVGTHGDVRIIMTSNPSDAPIFLESLDCHGEQGKRQGMSHFDVILCMCCYTWWLNIVLSGKEASGHRFGTARQWFERAFCKLRVLSAEISCLCSVIENILFLTAVGVGDPEKFFPPQLLQAQWLCMQILEEGHCSKRRNKFWGNHYTHDIAHLVDFASVVACSTANVSEEMPENTASAVFANFMTAASDGKNELMSRALVRWLQRGRMPSNIHSRCRPPQHKYDKVHPLKICCCVFQQSRLQHLANVLVMAKYSDCVCPIASGGGYLVGADTESSCTPVTICCCGKHPYEGYPVQVGIRVSNRTI